MNQSRAAANATTNIVIVGANFAGLSAAGKLAQCASAKVTVLDSAASFNWTPNIHEIVSSLKSPASVSISNAKNAERLGQRFRCDTASKLDTENNRVQLVSGDSLDYDALLLCCGLATAGLDTPGAAEHSVGMRRAEQARRIQQRIAVALANNKPYSISIVGAGFSGIEVLGELLRRHGNDERVSIDVIDAAPQILSGLPEVIGDDVRRHCEDFPVRFHLDRKIASMDGSAVHFDDGSNIASNLVIWCAGTTVPEIVRDSDLAQTRAGVLAHETLRAQNRENVFVAGDIAALEQPLKKQASYAMDMGKHAARNLERYIQGEPGTAFSPAEKPLLLSFGDINTYFIYKNTVLASPLLAPLKEAIYQFYMGQFAANLPPAEQGIGLVGRYANSVKTMLLPELLRFRFGELLGRSRRLQ